MQLTLPHLRLHLRKVLLSQPKRLARRRKPRKLKLLLLKRSPKHLLPLWSLPLSPSFLLKKEKDEWGIVIFGPTWIIFSNHESCFNASFVIKGSYDKASETSCYTAERFPKHICYADYLQWSWYVSFVDCQIVALDFHIAQAGCFFPDVCIKIHYYFIWWWF